MKKIGTGEKGGWGQALGVGKEYGTEGGLKGMAEGLGGLFNVDTKETVARDVPHAKLDLTAAEQAASTTLPSGDLVSLEPAGIVDPDLAVSELAGDYGVTDVPLSDLPAIESPIFNVPQTDEFTYPAEQLVYPVQNMPSPFEEVSEEVSTIPFLQNQGDDQSWSTTMFKQQGGLIPNKRPTISDYF